MSSKTRKITLGTKEWADSNVNCYFGCSNNCRYCYAKKMAIRFNRKNEDNWREMEPNKKSINKEYRKRNGRVMFPTSHDITEENLDGCLIVLKKLLRSGNDVLITSKPNFACVKSICDKLYKFKNLIQFRFTITSSSSNLLNFWEPSAPSYEERFESLKYAFIQGYKTSISIEPFLDENPLELVDKLKPYVTESIWIGKMNYLRSSIDSKKVKVYYDKIRLINTKENLRKIISNIEYHDKKLVRIKDSILNFLYG